MNEEGINKQEGNTLEALQALTDLRNLLRFLKPEDRMFPGTDVASPVELASAVRRLRENMTSLPPSYRHEAEALLLQAEIPS